MAKILANVFSALNRIYKFEGGGNAVGLNQLDMNTQVQPVHDLGRMAELGRYAIDQRFGGYYFVNQDNVHGAGGTIETPAIDPWALLEANFGSDAKQQLWAWLMHLSVTCIGGNLTLAKVNVAYNPSGASFQRQYLAYFGSAFVSFATVDTFTHTGIQNGATGLVSDPRPLHIPLPYAATLGFASTASAATTGRMSAMVWAGPLGVMPPGLA